MVSGSSLWYFPEASGSLLCAHLICLNVMSWWWSHAGHVTQKSKMTWASVVRAFQMFPASVVGVEIFQIFRLWRKVVVRDSPRLMGSASRFPAVSGYLSTSSKMTCRIGLFPRRAADLAQAI